MQQLFWHSIEHVDHRSRGITIIIIVGVTVLALTQRIFFTIGVRNIPRRRLQMVLIVFALMLSTTLLSSTLGNGDVINGTVQSVTVDNLGNVDEIVEGGRGAFSTMSSITPLVRREKKNPDIAAGGSCHWSKMTC